MPGLNSFRERITTKLTFSQVSPYEDSSKLRRRVDDLEEEEKAVFEWMLRFFSDRWIAETLMIGKRRLKEVKRVIFFKLGVEDERNMQRAYGFLAPPGNLMPDVGMIDSYVENRTEKEIRDMNEKGEKTWQT